MPTTAAGLGLTERHLGHLFGYGPKTLARILRMRRARWPWCETARAGGAGNLAAPPVRDAFVRWPAFRWAS